MGAREGLPATSAGSTARTEEFCEHPPPLAQTPLKAGTHVPIYTQDAGAHSAPFNPNTGKRAWPLGLGSVPTAAPGPSLPGDTEGSLLAPCPGDPCPRGDARARLCLGPCQLGKQAKETDRLGRAGPGPRGP